MFQIAAVCVRFTSARNASRKRARPASDVSLASRLVGTGDGGGALSAGRDGCGRDGSAGVDALAGVCGRGGAGSLRLPLPFAALDALGTGAPRPAGGRGVPCSSASMSSRSARAAAGGPSAAAPSRGIARLRRGADIGFELRDQIEAAQQVLARERGGQRVAGARGRLRRRIPDLTSVRDRPGAPSGRARSRASSRQTCCRS